MSIDFKDRIKIIDRINGIPIVFFKESDRPTLEENILLWKYIHEMSIEGPIYFIIDVSQATTPDAKIRAHTKENLNSLKNNLVHSYIVVGSNLLVKLGLNFILASMGLECFSVMKTKEDALFHIKNHV